MDPYPLLYAKVGSAVKNGEIMLMDMFDKPITRFEARGAGKTFMSGQSRYVHSEEMNKGSFGVSGSYGVSGISKYTASVSGYVGNAVARSSKVVSVNYNAQISAGVELVEVAKLTIAELIEAMSANPKNALLGVLDDFNSLTALFDEPGLTPAQIVNSPEGRQALRRWADSVEKFQTRYGDGFVLAVHWGAFGFVNMTMQSQGSSNSWIYGADADFSYAGLNKSVAVKATYAGSQSASVGEVNVTVSSQFMGPSIAGIIEKWRVHAEGKSFSELATVDMLSKAPPLEVPKGTRPAVPDFEKPKKDPVVAAKVAKVKHLENVESLATAQAYEQQAKTDPNLSIEDFVKQSAVPAEHADVIRSIDEGLRKLDELIDSIGGGAAADTRSEPADAAAQTLTESSSSERQVSDFVPLGVIVCNWSDIFPWLARGYFNSITDLTPALDILQWRGMIQDLQTLSLLYYTAAQVGLNLGENVSANQVADSFSAISIQLQNRADDDPYIDAIKSAFSGLSPTAQTIYRHWCKHGFLRRAELGLGVMFESEQSQSISATKTKWADTTYPMTTLSLAHCDFSTSSNNHSAFARFIKVLPIVLADGSVRAFSHRGYLGRYINYYQGVERTAETGLFTELDWTRPVLGPDLGIYKTRFEASKFKANTSASFLQTTDESLSLHPIPFAAAKGVPEWKGGAAGSCSLSSFEDLQKSIKDLHKQLEVLKAWSFSGGSYAGAKWSVDIGLSDLRVPVHCVGLDIKELERMQIFPR